MSRDAYYRQVMLYAAEIGWTPKLRWQSLYLGLLRGSVRVRFTRKSSQKDADSHGMIEVVVVVSDEDAWYKVAKILYKMAEAMDRTRGDTSPLADSPAELEKRLVSGSSDEVTPS